jgi:hypothetical protein
MLAPEHQEAYDDVIEQRTAAMSERIHGLFNSRGLVLDSHIGPTGRILTPSYLLSKRAFFQWATGTDSAPVTTIKERHLFNKLMVDNPCVGTPGSSFFLLLLDKWNEHLSSHNIYGKTVAHLARHHKNESTLINAKSRTVQEGSDGLVRLQKAVGVIREGVFTQFADVLNNWAVADDIVLRIPPSGNNLLPRQSKATMRLVLSLFGVSDGNNISKKRGRPTGVKNHSPRRRADCANRSCTRWYDCNTKGGYRKFQCEFGPVLESGFYKPREMQRRRIAFDRLLTSNPTLSKAQAGLAVRLM